MKTRCSSLLALAWGLLAGCAPNSPPLLNALRTSTFQLPVGQTLTVSASASDVDADRLSYAWSASCPGTFSRSTASSTDFTPTGLPERACDNCSLTVSVTDGRGGETHGSLALCITRARPPLIVSSWRSPDTVSASQALVFGVTASDPALSPLSFSWDIGFGSLGPAATGDSTSQVTWTAPACLPRDTRPLLTATITNAFGVTATQGFDVSGLPVCGVLAPTFTRAEGSSATATAGQVLTFKVEAEDPNDSELVFSWSASLGTLGPASSNAHSSQVTWTAPACVARNQTPTLTATVLNPFHLKATQGFEVPGIPVCGTRWTPAGSMATPRHGHSATPLPHGKVLVLGGGGAGKVFATAEVYEPSSGTWRAAAPMRVARLGHTVTPLPGGELLVVGGSSGTSLSTEVYQPSTDTWRTAAPTAFPRDGHTATLLPDGTVLVTGGSTREGLLTAAEVYQPSTDTWRTVGSMATPRRGHSATLLAEGTVLVLGGFEADPGEGLATAEVYTPATGTWSTADPMLSARGHHQATLLPDGRVLVPGGLFNATPLSRSEVYEPSSGTWSATAPLTFARAGYTATPLPQGTVLVSGGSGARGSTATAEEYDPATGLWSTVASLPEARTFHTMTPLPDGTVLVVGGFTHAGSALATAQVYTP